jgi:hypothetical protein
MTLLQASSARKLGDVVECWCGHAVDVASGHQTLQSRPAFGPITNVNTTENRDARNTLLLANSRRKSCTSLERTRRHKNHCVFEDPLQPGEVIR